MIRRFLVLLCFLCFASTAFGEQRPLEQVVTAIEERYSTLMDFSASFSQSTSIPGFPKPQQAQGTLALRRPEGGKPQFRFDYRSPRQTIVSDGTTLWYYQPEAQTVLIQRLDGPQGGNLARAVSFIADLGSIRRDFNISYATPAADTPGNPRLLLTPKRNGLFRSLQLTIAASIVGSDTPNSFPVLEAVLVDLAGTRTTFRYRDTAINQGLPASRFSFRVPPHTAVMQH
jgi:outer membrane lipoprotein carrier protein